MGRVTINGTIAQFSCKQSVTMAIWDADRAREQDSWSHEYHHNTDIRQGDKHKT